MAGGITFISRVGTSVCAARPLSFQAAKSFSSSDTKCREGALKTEAAVHSTASTGSSGPSRGLSTTALTASLLSAWEVYKQKSRPPLYGGESGVLQSLIHAPSLLLPVGCR
ncbi:hypothetical protein CDD83_4606 [Cordyceps sp. RAO-2017]|nr:hypothetical protein CDD83_4606 [Cordyceps sp. RAO-2017]